MTKSVAERVIQAKEEILADISDGYLPSDVATFSELHDYVDANGYGTDEDESNINIEELNETQCQVDAWLRAGRPS